MATFKVNTTPANKSRVKSIAALFGIENQLKSGLYEHVYITPSTMDTESSEELDALMGLDAFISHSTNAMIILKIYDNVLSYTIKEIVGADIIGNLTLGDTHHNLNGTIPCKGDYTDRLFSIFLNRVVGECKLVDVKEVILEQIYQEPETGCFIKPRDFAHASPETDEKVVVFDYLWDGDARKYNASADGVYLRTRVVFEHMFIKCFKLLK